MAIEDKNNRHRANVETYLVGKEVTHNPIEIKRTKDKLDKD